LGGNTLGNRLKLNHTLDTKATGRVMKAHGSNMASVGPIINSFRPPDPFRASTVRMAVQRQAKHAGWHCRRAMSDGKPDFRGPLADDTCERLDRNEWTPSVAVDVGAREESYRMRMAAA